MWLSRRLGAAKHGSRSRHLFEIRPAEIDLLGKVPFPNCFRFRALRYPNANIVLNIPEQARITVNHFGLKRDTIKNSLENRRL